ncbi:MULTISPECIES: TatD family hydrolase [Priestia]|jgi:TatD DNase family protein|uniref:Deoxyribonuclease, TatD family n=3 Tax=Priestia TaxID=2800373 RepID=D5DVL1_PRIM1|nr:MULTISPECIES: TatD family hydrolase [Priestia]AVX06279.1 TatD family deoxyribonuclease [Bacillus sp. Y-01]KOP77206.1 hydrolase TatD [Bacillus sp. FJAT-21351]KQU20817.1 hydrolase TatD [Bacillus sp. Leaf75]KRF51108.1 hydrolase TatD [Bacillus sp. Soil531]MBZ5482756.1 TatD family hydrolase [Bacillus sp. T_4]MCJ7984022.1 TatD family hydrolase [Priestia sp. OVL9]MDH6651689.1 TatD DNase family protein [Bacillus sp. PvP124]MDP9579982.1 TatD DNase family protein [Bacillus sp. 1751]MEB2278112.1 T
MLFDTHVHLNAEQYEDDLQEVINRALEKGVQNMVVVGFDEPTIKKAIQIAETYDFIYASVGWHPVDAVDMTDEHLAWIEELAQHPKVVALGEMGLDYHWDKSPKEVQKDVFRRQIRLARKVNLPIIIHNRDATEDVVTILKEEHVEEVGGIMHCFTGSIEVAKQCMDMNMYISFGGPVTFKNAKKPKEVATELPLDKLLIETDCPYLTPHPFRGKRNEPGYVSYVAEQIAELKGITYEELAAITTANAKKLFGIND